MAEKSREKLSDGGVLHTLAGERLSSMVSRLERVETLAQGENELAQTVRALKEKMFRELTHLDQEFHALDLSAKGSDANKKKIEIYKQITALHDSSNGLEAAAQSLLRDEAEARRILSSLQTETRETKPAAKPKGKANKGKKPELSADPESQDEQSSAARREEPTARVLANRRPARQIAPPSPDAPEAEREESSLELPTVGATLYLEARSAQENTVEARFVGVDPTNPKKFLVQFSPNGPEKSIFRDNFLKEKPEGSSIDSAFPDSVDYKNPLEKLGLSEGQIIYVPIFKSSKIRAVKVDHAEGNKIFFWDGRTRNGEKSIEWVFRDKLMTEKPDDSVLLEFKEVEVPPFEKNQRVYLPRQRDGKTLYEEVMFLHTVREDPTKAWVGFGDKDSGGKRWTVEWKTLLSELPSGETASSQDPHSPLHPDFKKQQIMERHGLKKDAPVFLLPVSGGDKGVAKHVWFLELDKDHPEEDAWVELTPDGNRTRVELSALTTTKPEGKIVSAFEDSPFYINPESGEQIEGDIKSIGVDDLAVGDMVGYKPIKSPPEEEPQAMYVSDVTHDADGKIRSITLATQANDKAYPPMISRSTIERIQIPDETRRKILERKQPRARTSEERVVSFDMEPQQDDMFYVWLPEKKLVKIGDINTNKKTVKLHFEDGSFKVLVLDKWNSSKKEKTDDVFATIDRSDIFVEGEERRYEGYKGNPEPGDIFIVEHFSKVFDTPSSGKKAEETWSLGEKLYDYGIKILPPPDQKGAVRFEYLSGTHKGREGLMIKKLWNADDLEDRVHRASDEERATLEKEMTPVSGRTTEVRDPEEENKIFDQEGQTFTLNGKTFTIGQYVQAEGVTGDTVTGKIVRWSSNPDDMSPLQILPDGETQPLPILRDDLSSVEAILESPAAGEARETRFEGNPEVGKVYVFGGSLLKIVSLSPEGEGLVELYDVGQEKYVQGSRDIWNEQAKTFAMRPAEASDYILSVKSLRCVYDKVSLTIGDHYTHPLYPDELFVLVSAVIGPELSNRKLILQKKSNDEIVEWTTSAGLESALPPRITPNTDPMPPHSPEGPRPEAAPATPPPEAPNPNPSPSPDLASEDTDPIPPSPPDINPPAPEDEASEEDEDEAEPAADDEPEDEDEEGPEAEGDDTSIRELLFEILDEQVLVTLQADFARACLEEKDRNIVQLEDRLRHIQEQIKDIFDNIDPEMQARLEAVVTRNQKYTSYIDFVEKWKAEGYKVLYNVLDSMTAHNLQGAINADSELQKLIAEQSARDAKEKTKYGTGILGRIKGAVVKALVPGAAGGVTGVLARFLLRAALPVVTASATAAGTLTSRLIDRSKFFKKENEKDALQAQVYARLHDRFLEQQRGIAHSRLLSLVSETIEKGSVAGTEAKVHLDSLHISIDELRDILEAKTQELPFLTDDEKIAATKEINRLTQLRVSLVADKALFLQDQDNPARSYTSAVREATNRSAFFTNAWQAAVRGTEATSGAKWNLYSESTLKSLAGHIPALLINAGVAFAVGMALPGMEFVGRAVVRGVTAFVGKGGEAALLERSRVESVKRDAIRRAQILLATGDREKMLEAERLFFEAYQVARTADRVKAGLKTGVLAGAGAATVGAAIDALRSLLPAIHSAVEFPKGSKSLEPVHIAVPPLSKEAALPPFDSSEKLYSEDITDPDWLKKANLKYQAELDRYATAQGDALAQEKQHSQNWLDRQNSSAQDMLNQYADEQDLLARTYEVGRGSGLLNAANHFQSDPVLGERMLESLKSGHPDWLGTANSRGKILGLSGDKLNVYIEKHLLHRWRVEEVEKFGVRIPKGNGDWLYTKTLQPGARIELAFDDKGPHLQIVDKDLLKTHAARTYGKKTTFSNGSAIDKMLAKQPASQELKVEDFKLDTSDARVEKEIILYKKPEVQGIFMDDKGQNVVEKWNVPNHDLKDGDIAWRQVETTNNVGPKMRTEYMMWKNNDWVPVKMPENTISASSNVSTDKDLGLKSYPETKANSKTTSYGNYEKMGDVPPVAKVSTPIRETAPRSTQSLADREVKSTQSFDDLDKLSSAFEKVSDADLSRSERLDALREVVKDEPVRYGELDYSRGVGNNVYASFNGQKVLVTRDNIESITQLLHLHDDLAMDVARGDTAGTKQNSLEAQKLMDELFKREKTPEVLAPSSSIIRDPYIDTLEAQYGKSIAFVEQIARQEYTQALPGVKMTPTLRAEIDRVVEKFNADYPKADADTRARLQTQLNDQIAKWQKK